MSAGAYGGTSQGRTRSKPRSMLSTATRPLPRKPTGARILALYDQLLAIAPTPIVALNRSVAVAEIDGPQVALQLMHELPLEHYYLFHAIRANLLQRLGRAGQAEAAYHAAIALTDNAAEIAFMKERISAIRAGM